MLYALHCSLDRPQEYFLLMVCVQELSVSTCLKLSILELSLSRTDPRRRDFPTHISTERKLEVVSPGKVSLTGPKTLPSVQFQEVPPAPSCCYLQHSVPTLGEGAAFVGAYLTSLYHTGRKSTLCTIMHYINVEYYCNYVGKGNPLKSKFFRHRSYPSLLPLSPFTQTTMGLT